MIMNERPGVYASYEVSSSISGAGRGVVGICAVSGSGDKSCSQAVSSYAQAVSLFGTDSSMAALIKTALLNGAALVRAVALNENASVADYSAAFELLKNDDDIKAIACDSRDAEVFTRLRESILTSTENHRYRIGIVELDGGCTALTAGASQLNCERMVLVNSVDAAPGATSVAVAAAIAAGSDPALPLSGAALYGLNGGSVFTDGEINLLVRGGVTPIENASSEISIVRAVTTRTTTGGSADSTWRELSTVLIIDDVIPSVRNALRTKFSRSKNTAQTRGAIRTQVIIELEGKLSREIIDSYANVSVAASAEDPTVCEVEFEFAVAHGLNIIELAAHITV